MNEHTRTVALESFLPGRMRLRIPHGDRKATLPGDLSKALGSLGSLVSVTANALSGAFLLEFSPEAIEVAEIVGALEAANIVLDASIHASKALAGILEVKAGPKVSQVAHKELGHIKAFDEILHRMTGGAAALRALIAFTLIALAFVEVQKEGPHFFAGLCERFGS